MAAASERSGVAPEGTKRQILDTAWHLFSDRSCVGVSMSDIAKRLGITAAALYCHFSGTTDIYRNVLGDVLSALRATPGVEHEAETLGDRLRRMARDYLDFGTREKNLVNALVVKLSPAEDKLRQSMASSREDLVEMFQPVIERILACADEPWNVSRQIVTLMGLSTSPSPR